MLEHYSSILDNGLLPRSARRPFFGRMAADFSQVPAAGVSRAAGPSRPETALICRDAYRAYAMLAPVNNARVMARRVLAGAS